MHCYHSKFRMVSVYQCSLPSLFFLSVGSETGVFLPGSILVSVLNAGDTGYTKVMA